MDKPPYVRTTKVYQSLGAAAAAATIRALTEETGCTIDIGEDGTITIASYTDGWTTLRRLRAQGLSDAPAAIVSANAFDKGLENDLGITPADFLVKPVRMAADGAAAGRRAACAGRTGAPVFSQQDIKDINTMRRG